MIIEGRRRALIVAVVAVAAFATGPVAPRPALGDQILGTNTFTFAPQADAYVDEAKPTTTYGTSASLWVDASSRKESFLRFEVTGTAGRTITGVHLRLYQMDASPSGGRVAAVSSNTWTESVNWDTRPAMDGPTLGSFGEVRAGTWYELNLGASAVSGDGPTSIGVDSPSDDGARWGSRESANPPQLVVDVSAVEHDGFAYDPSADAYVDAAKPDTSFGSAASLRADASPVRQTFIRYQIAGVAGRTVVGAHLRLYQTDASVLGGRIWSITSRSWTESITWNTRPVINGNLLATLGPVQSNAWHDIDLNRWDFINGDGSVSLAIDSTSADLSAWTSREGIRPPQLIVDVAPVAGLVIDGVTQVAAPSAGSSDPTSFGGNKRMAVTAGGRLLAAYGRHVAGVQLAWRDPGSGWQTVSQGDVHDGLLLSTASTGDRPASMDTARDQTGQEHAWVVWSGSTSTSATDVELRRLSALDAPGGPTVGPAVIVAPTGQGNSKADLAFEQAPDGRLRGCIAWLQRTGSSSWNVVTAWFTDLDTDVPVFHDASILLTSSTGARAPTLVPTPDGLRLVVRNSSGALQIFGHDSGSGLTQWRTGATGVAVSGSSYPAVAPLDSGGVLAVVESDTVNHVVTVERFSPDGDAASVDLRLAGYKQPSIATGPTGAWLLMVRSSDGYVVSRELSDSGWTEVDRVELGAAGGGNYSWPNALRRVDGRLRFVVRGPAGGSAQNSVLAFQRVV